MEVQAFYKLNQKEWNMWLDKISEFCELNNTDCYAEEAFNEISDQRELFAFDMGNRLCAEIDTPEDLAVVKAKLAEIENRTIYMCFSTDIIHSVILLLSGKWQNLADLL